MICEYTLNKYCKDDFSLIENYDKAIADTTQTWHCHHRRETDEGLSLDELKERGLYYNRPATELIFLTQKEHNTLHDPFIDKSNFSFKDRNHTEEYREHMSAIHSGENNPMYSKSIKDYMTDEAYASWLKKQQGENNSMYGKKHTKEAKQKQSEKRKQYLKNRTEIHITNGINSKRIDISEFDKYKSLGYRRGRTLKNANTI